MPKRHEIRIHGDNILECESALKLLATSLSGGLFDLKRGPAYAPVYEFKSDTNEIFEVQLFPGYGRWNFPLVEYIASLGGTLREAPDAIITRVEVEDKHAHERPILSFEFCGALPAGNNAWQRTGRALALAHAGIPYLYFAELGGQELDSSRVIKAARFPNPLVPFAYAVLGMSSNSISLPIYLPSPSIEQKVVEIFDNCFGTKESVELVRGVMLSQDIEETKSKIEKKVLKILEILSQQRKRSDILKPEEWKEFFSKKTGPEKADWLIKRAMPWNKKTGIKTLTPSFYRLLKIVNESGAVAIGSKEMPICIISGEKRSFFASKIKVAYKEKISPEFVEWVSNSARPLLCVWIAGFKPKGDDSRPDRGLVPLARMIFGIEDIDLMSVIYGPAKPSTWSMLEKDMAKLASINGLWEAIINLSNAIIIDSNTAFSLKNFGFLVKNNKKSFDKQLLPAAVALPYFGEHDVDSVLHLLFSKGEKEKVYESMCNPPGGDWSGINILEIHNKVEFRWTSLPRVSGQKSKRPDHLIEFCNDNILLSIESKDVEGRLEEKIGPKLTDYVSTLLNKSPVAFRKFGEEKWEQYKGKKLNDFQILSGAAFRLTNVNELKKSMAKGRVDVVFGVEFNASTEKTIIHILANERGRKLLPIIKKLAVRLEGLVEIKIY